VRGTRNALWPGYHLLPATVDQLVLWLRNRLPDICDQHPDIADLAADLRNLRGDLRAAAGQLEDRPEPCPGIPCRRCDMLTLFKHPGDGIHCANPDCAAVLREDEYTDWLKTLTAATRIAS
jgi:hypothetical protein